jgi:hypothetical protein
LFAEVTVMAVPQERFRVAERAQLTPLETARISWAGDLRLIVDHQDAAEVFHFTGRAD